MSGMAQSCTNSVAESQENFHASGGDRISYLPNDVIVDILSLLPIKDAVQTCVLARDWKLKWTLINIVNIDANQLFPQPWSDHEIFVNFVEKILIHLRRIKEFHLILSSPATYSGNYEWISSAMRRGIDSLELSVNLPNHDGPILHHSLLNCSSLKYLLLKMYCTFKFASNNSFPNLTRLSLARIKILNEHSTTDTVVFNFPVLKVLDLVLCEWLKVNLVEINAPSLITVNSITGPETEESNHSIKIVGAKLEELKMYFSYPENIVLANSTITTACLGRFPFSLSLEKYGSRFRRLLRELSQVKHMLLVGDLEVIACTKIGPPLLRFPELKSLHVHAPFKVEGLLELLHGAPFLRFLLILLEDKGEDEDDYEGKTVPSCFVSYLEGIVFDFSKSWKPKFELVKFVLANGLKLKNVVVEGSPSVPANKIIKQLQTFPKGSTCLKFRGIQNP